MREPVGGLFALELLHGFAGLSGPVLLVRGGEKLLGEDRGGDGEKLVHCGARDAVFFAEAREDFVSPTVQDRADFVQHPIGLTLFERPRALHHRADRRLEGGADPQAEALQGALAAFLRALERDGQKLPRDAAREKGRERTLRRAHADVVLEVPEKLLARVRVAVDEEHRGKKEVRLHRVAAVRVARGHDKALLEFDLSAPVKPDALGDAHGEPPA